MDAIKKEQKLIISTIPKDFGNSPIMGHIKIPIAPAQQQHQQTSLSNPFADNATINQEFETEINDVLSSPGDSIASKTPIQCNFGMNISKWICKI